AALQFRLSCGRPRHYLVNDHTFVVGAALSWLRCARRDSEVTANDSPLLQQALQGCTNRVRRNSKANARGSLARRNDGRIDPNDFAAKINQWASAVAGIDCCICLQEISESVGAVWPHFRTDNAVRYRLVESERIADGQNKVSGLHRI